MLDPRLATEIRKKHQSLHEAGELPTREQLARYYATFRERFGPGQLAQLDGKVLLETMHAHRSDNRGSLVYWLEFKSDNEFPAIFGSIAGGSALKFGIYQRKETGIWMMGSPQDQQELTVEEAIQVARIHREQLGRGCALLEALPAGASDEEYRQLQERMDQLVFEVSDDPRAHRYFRVSDKAWGHKYFSLMFPEKLDDYHVPSYQSFHLIKLLQPPPEGEGRFRAAGQYVSIAAELEMPMNHLTTTLNRLHGRPYEYWRIGTKLGGTDSIWSLMQEEGCVAVGWNKIGDLSELSHDSESKETLRAQMKEKHPNTPQAVGQATSQLFAFATTISEGDLILAADGMQVLGVGRVTGRYQFVPGTVAPHRRPVEWLCWDEWLMPTKEGLQRTVTQLRKHPGNKVEAERRILGASPIVPETSTDTKGKPISAAAVKLTGIPGRIQTVLERKGQVILYGPPGTGKTFFAQQAARDLGSYFSTGSAYTELSKEQKARVDDHLVRMCSFHPAYGYEDFMEGYRPLEKNGQLVFERKEGIFKQLCEEARNNPAGRYYLIIDEINRGDIPRIFGELLTVLERDKRGAGILLPLSNERFSVPENVYLIGTMNTADRSIALLDTALRRRFGFIELMPDTSMLGGVLVDDRIPLGLWLEALNGRILEHIGRDARNLQVGHAYLLEKGRPVIELRRFVQILEEDILPLLEEYCYEDYGALARILGNGLVDEERQRVRHELFRPARWDDLVQELLKPFPEITASRRATLTNGARVDEEDVDDEDDQMIPDEEGSLA